MAERKKQSLLNGAMVLSMAVIVVKFISIFFKIYLTYAIGYDGRGYYATAYNIYTPIYSIALAGLPTAVSKLVAEYAAKGRFKDVRTLMKSSKQLFVGMGIVSSLIVLLVAYPYVISNDMLDALPSILALTPSLFFCCIMSSYRGYYQGMMNMTPSALSQIFEAIGKLIFSFVLINAVTLGFLPFLDNIPILKDYVTDTVTAYAAAGAITGVTIGAVCSYLYLAVRYRAKSDGITEAEILSSPDSNSAKYLRKQLIKVAIPVAASAMVSNVTTLIDNWTVQNRLQYVLDKYPYLFTETFGDIVQALGYTETKELKAYLFGAYDTVLEIKNVVPTLTITFGLSAIPFLSEKWFQKDKVGIKFSVESVLRMTFMTAFPAGIGMAVLSRDLLEFLYGISAKNSVAIPHITSVLILYGLTVFTLALEQPLVNMLQAVNRLDIPVKAMAAGAGVKIIGNFIFVGMPGIHINGAAIGSALCNLTIDIICYIYLIKVTQVRVNVGSVCIKPLFCSLCAGAAGWAFNGIAELFIGDFKGISLLNGQNAACAIGICAAVAVYGISLLLTQTVPKEDIKMLPKGAKIARVLERHGLIG